MNIVDNVFANGALCTLGLQIIGFVFASILKTETFYDVLGGCNYLLLVYLGGFPMSPSSDNDIFPGPEMFTFFFIISRSWLLLFLAWRAHSRKGDARFDEVIDKPLIFLLYWMVQATWVYTISLPLIVVQNQTKSENITTLEIVSLVGFAFGIILEVSSDIQKATWVENGRVGGFCEVGWWKFSRHPNYAGEILQWWFAFFYSYLSTGSVIGILSPLFTMFILLNLNGTGIMHAEGKNLKRYYESAEGDRYKQYRLKTSPLFPMIGYQYVPKQLQRLLLFEWEVYEYKPKNKQI